MFACSASAAQPATPVILISVDTLRADHLSCYKSGQQKTPHIDSLAKNGTLFSEISSPYPLTLPSHVALFTSTYPFENGVEDNGIPLHAGAVTLATVLKAAGYRTGAFVGSFILDQRFGLNRGFDVYDGPFDLRRETATGAAELKRPGANVAEAAMHWLDRNSAAPFFLFLHLYDLHAPYDLPADPSQRHGETGYRAELAYVDRVLGDFVAYLNRRGLFEKSLIVFTSDHGEGLGEHVESTHGYFVYQSTLHVPLIFHWPAGARRIKEDRVDEPASLLDVAPTILDAIGASRPGAMRGHSLIAPAGTREIYSESRYARDHFGCAVLRSMRVGRYKYIEAPKPELYDLAGDPNELENLYSREGSKAKALAEKIAAVRASAPAGHTGKAPGSETAAALRSLGYLSGSTRSSRVASTVDPKDRAKDFEQYLGALGLAARGELAASDAVLEKLRGRMPEVAEIRISLGLNQQRLGEFAQAAREFKFVAERAPSNAQAHFELGLCYFRLRQPNDAAREFKAALAIEPWYSRADEALAEVYLQANDPAQARAHLKHLLSVDPHSYSGHYNLGVLAAMEKNWNEAQQQVLAALRTDPGSAEAHNTLGGIYLERGDLERARRQFEEAVRLENNLASAHYNLGMILQKQGKNAEAEREFRAAQQAEAQPNR